MKTIEILQQSAIDELRRDKNGEIMYLTDSETYITCETKHGFHYVSLDGKHTPYFRVHYTDDGFAIALDLPFYYVEDDNGYYPIGSLVVLPLYEDARNAGWLKAESLPDPDLDCDFTIDLGW